MKFEVMAQCADMILADAIQDTAKKTGRSADQIRQVIVDSTAYDALYNFETGLWGQGPEYFIAFTNKMLEAKGLDTIDAVWEKL